MHVHGARPLGRALCALGLGVVAACSGDDARSSAPPSSLPVPVAGSGAAYVAELCGATVSWRDELGDLVEELSRGGVGVDDVGVRKQLLLDFVADGQATTATFVDGLAATAPSPDVSARLETAEDELDAVWLAAREEVEGFPDEADPEPFVSRGVQMTNHMEQTAAVWKTAVRDLRAVDPALDAAFSADPSCSTIPRTADR